MPILALSHHHLTNLVLALPCGVAAAWLCHLHTVLLRPSRFRSRPSKPRIPFLAYRRCRVFLLDLKVGR
ncbi:hypothetical protein CGRA01v4_02817 [Colletotrichum graminicola]|nr:hypothetical protein CGRA01v4_02817 [Colletotrichum graminicola]